MKKNLFYPVVLIMGLILASFTTTSTYSQTQKAKTSQNQTVKYTCTMHSEVVQDKPGNCPKCGMKLVVKKEKPITNVNQKQDSTMVKHDHRKMVQDTTRVRKQKMDSTTQKHNHMDMKH